ncbi:hypothetical protein [Nonomuraea glycinis]|uniref:hypothetical protein n=1 Tax=Nonomuraea glycinis TaxID=2047744 RepID=UPI0033B9C2BB
MRIASALTGFAGALFDPIGMGDLFGLSALVVLAGQSRLTGWARRRRSHAQRLVRGLAVSGAAFLPLALVGAPVIPPGWPVELAEHIAIIPILATALLLAVGTMLICPFAMDMIVSSLPAGGQPLRPVWAVRLAPGR